MRHIQGKRALVTGAGHGLGRELARVFASAGAEVLVTDRDLAGAGETQRVVASEGGVAHAYGLDVTNPDGIAELRSMVHKEHGAVDLLINNAGVVHGGAFEDVPLEQHLATYRVNIEGTVAVTHAFLADLLGRSEAHLVNIASASGLIALPFASTYASSKWAVIGFSESLREELRLMGNQHVRVTAVCPSYIGTGMCAGARVPLFSRMLDARGVAEAVLRAVQRDREELLLPALVKLTPLSRGILPRSWFRAVCRRLGITTSMATWYGHRDK